MLSGVYNLINGIYIDLIVMLVVVVVIFWVFLEVKIVLCLNNLMVFVKFGIILLFVFVGIFYVKLMNW